MAAWLEPQTAATPIDHVPGLRPETLALIRAQKAPIPAPVRAELLGVERIRRQGVTCIIVEQDLRRALAVATQVCVMLEGTIVLEGTPQELSEARITAAYFGQESMA